MLKIVKMINARRKDIYFKNGNCFYAIANSDLIFRTDKQKKNNFWTKIILSGRNTLGILLHEFPPSPQDE